MYVRLPMMEKWEDFLLFLGEIRRALAMDSKEIEQARLLPTITRDEFHEMLAMAGQDFPEAEEQHDQRWRELCAKIINFEEVQLLETDGDWRMKVEVQTTLSYERQRNRLMLELTGEWDARYIVPLMARLVLILPNDMIVQYSPLLVSTSNVMSNDGRSVERYTELTCSELEAEGDFWTFALKTAMLHNAQGTKRRHKVRPVKWLTDAIEASK